MKIECINNSLSDICIILIQIYIENSKISPKNRKFQRRNKFFVIIFIFVIVPSTNFTIKIFFPIFCLILKLKNYIILWTFVKEWVCT